MSKILLNTTLVSQSCIVEKFVHDSAMYTRRSLKGYTDIVLRFVFSMYD